MFKVFLKYTYLLISLTAFSVMKAKGQDVQLSAIGATKGPPGEMRFTELQSVLRGEKHKWPDGTKVVIALFNPITAPGNTTCKKIFNMSVDQLKKYWLGVVFQGKADPPYFFKTKEEVEAFVTTTLGAVGVVPQPPVIGKTIVIDGKKFF